MNISDSTLQPQTVHHFSEQHTVNHANEANKKPSEEKSNSLDTEAQSNSQSLKDRDREVKAHEQAHLSAAGELAIGGASFSYTTAPNGERYATGGEVSIDTSPVANDPEATIRKADTIRRAALAPSSPSSQDQSVASQATSMAAKARAELAQQIDTTQPDDETNGLGALIDIAA